MATVLEVVKQAQKADEVQKTNVRTNAGNLLRLSDAGQRALAAEFGVTPQAVSGWLSGRTRPPAGFDAGLAVFFGVPLDILRMPWAEVLRWMADHPDTLGGAKGAYIISQAA